MLKPFFKFRENLALMALLALGFLLKLPTLFHDLPPFNFCDEGIFTLPAMDIFYRKYRLSSEFRAGQISIYLGVLANVLMSAFRRVLSLSDIIQNSRLLTLCVLNSLTGFLLFKTVVRVFGSKLQAYLVWGAYLLSPAILGIARWHYPDHYISFFVALFLYFFLASKPRSIGFKQLCLIGISWGLVCSVKYTGFFLVIPIFIYFVSDIFRGQIGNLFNSRTLFKLTIMFGVVFGFAGIAFFMTNPGLIRFPKSFVNWFMWNVANYTSPAERSFANNYAYYAFLAFIGPFGGFAILVALISSLRLFKENRALTLVLWSFPICLILKLGSYEAVMSRTMLVTECFVLLLISYGIRLGIERWKAKPIYLFLFLGILLVEPIFRGYVTLSRDLRPDARRLASEWVKNNIPKEAKIAEVEVCGTPHQMLEEYRGIWPRQKADFFLESSWSSPRFSTGQSTVWNTWNLMNHHFMVRGGLPFTVKEREIYLKSIENFEIIKEFKGYGPDIFLYQRVR